MAHEVIMAAANLAVGGVIVTLGCFAVKFVHWFYDFIHRDSVPPWRGIPLDPERPEEWKSLSDQEERRYRYDPSLMLKPGRAYRNFKETL